MKLHLNLVLRTLTYAARNDRYLALYGMLKNYYCFMGVQSRLCWERGETEIVVALETSVEATRTRNQHFIYSGKAWCKRAQVKPSPEPSRPSPHG
jgi:hypothetical protein